MWKIGIHNCYWLGSGCDDLYSALEASAKAGVDVYEMNTGVFFQLKEEELKDFRAYAEKLGLGLSVNGGFDLSNDISADDPAIRAKGIAAARKILDGMYIVGAHSWSGINYGAWKRVPNPAYAFPKTEKERIRALSIVSLKEIIKIAEDRDVTMCFEVVNRYEQFLCNTVAEGVAMAEEVGSPRCKVLLDTYHMNIEEDSMIDAIHYAAQHKKIGEIHMGESNRRVPGTGKTNLDWPGIFGAIREISYDGLITMEPFLVEGLPISSRICVWRDLSQRADTQGFIENVRRGAAFIRSFEHVPKTADC